MTAPQTSVILRTFKGNNNIFLIDFYLSKFSTIKDSKFQIVLQDLNSLKLDIATLSKSIENNEFSESTVYLLSRSWLNKLENQLENSKSVEILEDFPGFNEEIIENLENSKIFLKYKNDYRGLNIIFREEIDIEGFYVLNLKLMKKIQTKFKGTTIKRQLLIESDGLSRKVEVYPLKIKILRLTKKIIQNLTEPQIYPDIISLFQINYLQIFPSMTIKELYNELYLIMNSNEFQNFSKITDSNLFRLWKIPFSFDLNSLLGLIKGNNSVFHIKEGVLLQKEKDFQLNMIPIDNNDIIIFEAIENKGDNWLIQEVINDQNKINDFSAMKRDFASFLNLDSSKEIINPLPIKKIHIEDQELIKKNETLSILTKKDSFPNIEIKSIVVQKRNIAYKGIRNLGNTCYINSVIQSLYHLKFMQELHNATLNFNYSKDSLISGLWNVISRLNNKSLDSVCSPDDFILQIKRKFTSYSNGQQHDAHEFLFKLIETLNDETKTLNKIIANKKTNNTAVNFWEGFILKNGNFFIDHLYGLLENSLNCILCKGGSIIYEPFLALNLSLPSNDSEDDCFKLYYVMDQIDINPRVALINLNKNSFKDKNIFYLENFLINNCENINIQNKELILSISNEKRFIKFIKNKDILINDVFNQGQQTFFFEKEKEKVNESWIPLVFREKRTNKHEEFISLPRFIKLSNFENLYDCLKKANEFLTNLLTKIASFCNFRQGKEFDINLRFNKNNNDDDFCVICESKNDCLCDLTNKTLDEITKKRNNVFLKIRFFIENLNSTHLETLKILKKAIKYGFKITLNDLIIDFTKEEKLDSANKWLCSTCGRNQQALKKIDIYSASRVCIFQLKRFKDEIFQKRKILRKIDFPIHNFNLTDFLKMKQIPSELEKENENKNITYDLRSVICHSGNEITSGHYYSITKCSDNKWYKFDDSNVTEESIDNICNNESYILFYERIII